MRSTRLKITLAGVGVVLLGAFGYIAISRNSAQTELSKSDERPSESLRVASPAGLLSSDKTPPPEPASKVEVSSVSEPVALGAGSDVRERYLACLSIKSADERLRKFLELIEDLRVEDIPMVRDLVIGSATRGTTYGPEWGAFWRKWGSIDPQGAALFLSENETSRWAGDALHQTLRGWSEKDPDQALAWISKNQSSDHFREAFLGFVDGRTAIDPYDATRRVISALLPGDPLAGPAMERISEAVLRSGGANGLRSWFDSLPADSEGMAFRKAAMDHVHWRLLQEGIETTAEWTGRQASTPWRSDRIIAEIARIWGKRDPAAAMEWVLNQPKNPKTGVITGVGDVVDMWSKSNPPQLENWLNSVRGTQAFEQGARDYGLLLAKKNPDQALYWAAQITDPRRRNEVIAAATRKKTE